MNLRQPAVTNSNACFTFANSIDYTWSLVALVVRFCCYQHLAWQVMLFALHVHPCHAQSLDQTASCDSKQSRLPLCKPHNTCWHPAICRPRAAGRRPTLACAPAHSPDIHAILCKVSRDAANAQVHGATDGCAQAEAVAAAVHNALVLEAGPPAPECGSETLICTWIT